MFSAITAQSLSLNTGLSYTSLVCLWSCSPIRRATPRISKAGYFNTNNCDEKVRYFFQKVMQSGLPEYIGEQFYHLCGMLLVFQHCLFYKTVSHVHYLQQYVYQLNIICYETLQLQAAFYYFIQLNLLQRKTGCRVILM